MDISEIRCLPIGFMDSGLGGLSVLKEELKLLPYEDFIYYGDSANAPYGEKSTEEIKRLTFSVTEKLMEQGIKGLVVACNTATAAAVRELRRVYPKMPIVGIEPAVKPAYEMSRGGRIIVMATPMAIRQEKFRQLIARYEKLADIVTVPCGGLMEFVEKGELDGDVLDGYFREHLSPYITDNTETVVLGCTHYPFLRPHLREFLAGRGDGDIRIIDGSRGTAAEMKRRLEECGLLRTDTGRAGVLTIENSAGDEMVERSYKLLKLPT
ncbi:MAG: glutamate racemase, partial [Candidatus Avispirillum sp.]